MCNTILFCLFNIYIFARLGSRVGENILHTLCETSAKWVKVKESHYKCLMRYSFIRDIDFPQAENQDPTFRFFSHCDTFLRLYAFRFNISDPFHCPRHFWKIAKRRKRRPDRSSSQALHQSASSIMRNLHFRIQKEKQKTKKKKKGILILVFYAFCKTYWSKIAVGFFYLRYEIRNFVYC